MDLAAVLAQHVHALHGHALHGAGRPGIQEPERLAELSRDLDQLARTVSGQVPSCLSVSLVLTAVSGAVTVRGGPAASGGSGHGRRPARASLAVPLPLPTVGLVALLVLQAADPDAFLLLADDLTGRLGRHGVRLDLDLDLQVGATGPVLAGDLADLRDVDRAAGALMEQGWTGDDAYDRLCELAVAERTGVPAAARRLLAGLRPPTVPGSEGSGDHEQDDGR